MAIGDSGLRSFRINYVEYDRKMLNIKQCIEKINIIKKDKDVSFWSTETIVGERFVEELTVLINSLEQMLQMLDTSCNKLKEFEENMTMVNKGGQ